VQDAFDFCVNRWHCGRHDLAQCRLTECPAVLGILLAFDDRRREHLLDEQLEVATDRPTYEIRVHLLLVPQRPSIDER